MPSKNAVTVACSDQTYNAIKALASANGKSLSRTVNELLNDIAPQILQVAQAIQLAKSHIEHNDNKLHDHMQQLLVDMQSQAFELSQIDLDGFKGVKNES